jgi:Inner membrane component of T3SS, cytoplasmic domain
MPGSCAIALTAGLTPPGQRVTGFRDGGVGVHIGGVGRVFEFVAGPDAGRLVGLAPGRHLVGRAAGCRVVIDDPAVESHHAVVTVGAAGGLHLAQVAGRRPVLVDGRPVGDGTVLGPRAAIEIGDTLIVRRDALGTPGARRPELARLGGGRVVLGVGTVRLPLPGRRPEVAVAHDVQVAIDRLELHHRHPVLADLAAADGVVIGPTATAGDPGALAARDGVLASIVAQLTADPVSCRWPVLHGRRSSAPDQVDPASERVLLVTGHAAPLVELGLADRLLASGVAVTALLLVDPASPALRRCTSVLHLGARWRARWVADTAETADPLAVVRLHVRGVRAAHATATAAA